MAEVISSAQNPKIKRLLALQKDSSLRREFGLFVVEGRRELEHCLSAGYEIDTLFICPEIASAPGVPPPETSLRSSLPQSDVSPFRSKLRPVDPPACGPLPSLRDEIFPPIVPQGTSAFQGPRAATVSGEGTPGATAPKKFFEVNREVYEKVAYRGGTEGVIAEVKAKRMGLEDLRLPENPLIVVLESVEKPGNLGAVLRSADAAGADAVLVCDPLTDLYNPNLIRASIGAIFTVPCVACSSADAIAWLQKLGVQILTAQLQDSSLYYDTDMRRGTALVMGTESTGLSQAWRSAATAHIRIPMLGRLDSLNVSVSAAILLFEAVRQRQN